jgi:hypothetical protein
VPCAEATFGDLDAHQQEEACLGARRNLRLPIGPGMAGNQKNWIRPKNLLLARSIGRLDPCRPRVHEGLPFITYVLLATISIAMTHGLGHAQAPVASHEATLPSATTPHEGSTSIHAPSDQVAPVRVASKCKTRFPNLRRTPQKPLRRSQRWTTLPCPHVVNSTCI